MAAVYRNQRKLGKIWPNGAGAIVAATIGGKRLGCFTSADLAIAAILDLAKRPLTVEGYLALVEAFIVEEDIPSARAAYAIDVAPQKELEADLPQDTRAPQARERAAKKVGASGRSVRSQPPAQRSEQQAKGRPKGYGVAPQKELEADLPNPEQSRPRELAAKLTGASGRSVQRWLRTGKSA
jgi:hypothetical protein